MIRVRKSDAPPELAQHGYSADGVKRVLIKDQDDKCYLCEQKVGTNYEVEHLQSQHNHEELKNSWENLFLACSYCNRKKGDDFDEILDPTSTDVELQIEQRYNSKTDSFEFTPTATADAHVTYTIELLDRLFNGTNPKMLKLKEERFRELFWKAYGLFQERVNAYLSDPTNAEARKLISSELKITSEHLGFKYWYIKSIPSLYQEFESEMAWNRQQR